MGQNIQSIINDGMSGTIIDIECRLSNNLPTIVIVGLAAKAVVEARERLRGAFASSRIMLPRKRITVNLAPADIPKADSGFDLAIAVSILAANGSVTQSLGQNQAFIGELGLDGRTRAVRGIIGKILAGRAKGVEVFFIPVANLPQAQLIPGVKLIPIVHLGELVSYLCDGVDHNLIDTGGGQFDSPASATLVDSASGEVRPSEIVNQPMAKRALEISAAGGHNLLFEGPPGVGKSLLARALAWLLPPPTREEVLEITQLHSLASQSYDRLVDSRPFRAPHHSASYSAMIGGGSRLTPGEISLAHHGVLLMDEMPEFHRQTLEALRQPLENNVISLARSGSSGQLPADFILVATANPCPCGYYGSARCQCSGYDVARYQLKLSGPVMDRIDLYCYVGALRHDNLLSNNIDASADNAARMRVHEARAIQKDRFSFLDNDNVNNGVNARISNEHLKQVACLTYEARQSLDRSANKHQFSARAYFRTLKVARTIADLAGCYEINKIHVDEAIQLNPALQVTNRSASNSGSRGVEGEI